MGSSPESKGSSFDEEEEDDANAIAAETRTKVARDIFLSTSSTLFRASANAVCMSAGRTCLYSSIQMSVQIKVTLRDCTG